MVWLLTFLALNFGSTLWGKMTGLQAIEIKLMFPHQVPALLWGHRFKFPACIQGVFLNTTRHVGCINVRT